MTVEQLRPSPLGNSESGCRARIYMGILSRTISHLVRLSATMWATKHPIEVVVAAFTLATLAYFHALADVSRQLDSTSLFLEFSNGQWSPTAAAKVHDWSWDVFQLLTDSSNNSWHPPSGALAHVAPGSLTLALPKDSANIPIPSLPLPQALFNHVSALASVRKLLFSSSLFLNSL